MSQPALSAQPAPEEQQPLRAVRDAPVGGQAVLEGVMMRGVSTWAVAVRKPDGEIAVTSEPFVSVLKRHRFYRLPLVRGVVALVESLKIGLQALGISTNAQLEEEDEQISGGAWAGTVAFSLALAIGIFFLLPVGITSIFKSSIPSGIEFVLIEKAIRITIFIGYLWGISRIKDLQRVFEYHGAEHKTISCYEAALPLTPENAQRFSRLHPRCGTSFLLIVMIVALFVFAPLGKPAWYILFSSRIIGIPIVAGIAFEIIKIFGKHRSKRWAQILMWPGMQLQKLTTRPPDLSQLAVAIAALEAVLAVENPEEASDEDRVGMEVVA
ncbi:MAG TPA: DUF1385 domain-containing protein [Thermoleophilaceae bacterium]|jgi:uncharacterized protein YqhQ|nr:DUF1385 domain-containing protein [Thermoleophilaceae bacterium]